MIDGIIKADGTSRLMRATLPATYEEFRAQCAAGTQPLDVLFNALGWSQLPTFLNKANLAQDSVAALFGKSAYAVPNDLFEWIGQYATHWWSREGAVPATFELGSEETDYAIASAAGNGETVYYSDSVTVSDSGTVTLTAPISSFKVTGDNESGNDLKYLNNIKGKFFYTTLNSNTQIYYRTATNDAYIVTQGTGAVEVTKVSARPVYGVPATSDGEVTYVHSTDRNAYPDSGTVDGLTYEYLGIPFQNAVTAPKIATGSYRGTGTYGSSNKNSLTFDFEPKLVLLSQNYNNGIHVAPLIRGSNYAGVQNSANTKVLTVSWKGNSVSWYGTESAALQFNNSDRTYAYAAIG